MPLCISTTWWCNLAICVLKRELSWLEQTFTCMWEWFVNFFSDASCARKLNQLYTVRPVTPNRQIFWSKLSKLGWRQSSFSKKRSAHTVHLCIDRFYKNTHIHTFIIIVFVKKNTGSYNKGLTHVLCVQYWKASVYSWGGSWCMWLWTIIQFLAVFELNLTWRMGSLENGLCDQTVDCLIKSMYQSLSHGCFTPRWNKSHQRFVHEFGPDSAPGVTFCPPPISFMYVSVEDE